MQHRESEEWMSKPHRKEWKFIGKITEEWVKASYPNAIVIDSWKYKDRLNNFFGFLGVTNSEFIEGYKRAKDRQEWSRKYDVYEERLVYI